MLLGSVLAGPLVFSLVLWTGGVVAARGRAHAAAAVERRRAACGRRARSRIGTAGCGLWAIEVEDRFAGEGTAPANERPTRRRRIVSARRRRRDAGTVDYEGRLATTRPVSFRPAARLDPISAGAGPPQLVVVDQPGELIVHPKLGAFDARVGAGQSARIRPAASACRGAACSRPISMDCAIGAAATAAAGSIGALRPAVVRSWCANSSSAQPSTWRWWSICGSPPTPRDQQRANVETAVSFAATVIADACRQRGRHVSVAPGGAASCSIARGRPRRCICANRWMRWPWPCRTTGPSCRARSGPRAGGRCIAPCRS